LEGSGRRRSGRWREAAELSEFGFQEEPWPDELRREGCGGCGGGGGSSDCLGDG